MAPKHLIIDGYNLLGAMGLPPQYVIARGEAYREQFIERLGIYGLRVRCSITVIFDAWRQAGGLRQTSHHTGVTVMYSAEGERADQVIQQLIRRYGNETAVVSSDREVTNVAHTYGAFVIRSQEFARLLEQGKQEKRSRSVGRSSQGLIGGKDDERDVAKPGAKEKKGNPRKLPKKLRQRNRIMKRF